MKRIFYTIIILIFFSCKDDVNSELKNKTRFQININGKFAEKQWNKKSIYRNFQDFPIKIEKVNFFLSSISLNSNSKKIQISTPFLYRNNLDKIVTSKKYELKSFGVFTSLKSQIGVPKSINKSDPTKYPSTNDYSINQASDMHWTWNTGYIFLKIEGKYDSIPNSQVTPLNFSWHIGNQINLDSIEINYPISIIENELNTLNLSFDLNKVFLLDGDTVWINKNPVTHSSISDKELSKKIINNFAKSIVVQ